MREEKESLELLQWKKKALEREITILKLQSQLMQIRHDKLMPEFIKVAAEIQKIEEANKEDEEKFAKK